MNKRLLFLTVLGLGASAVSAQPSPAGAPPQAVEVAPPQGVEPPAVQVTVPQPLPPAAPPLVQPLPPVGPQLLVQPGPQLQYRARPPRLPSPQLHAVEPRRHGNAGAPFALGIGGSLLWRNDHAQHVLSDHKLLGAVELFVSYDVWTPTRGLIVAVGASVRGESRLGNDDYELRSHAIQAEAMARYGVTSWLWPHVRLGIGGVTTRFQQHDRSAGLDFDDRSGSVLGSLGAGFTLRTPTRLFETHQGWLASLSLGLLVEGGYTLAQDAALHLEPTQSGEVRRASFGLGKVERSAPYLRIMGVIRL